MTTVWRDRRALYVDGMRRGAPQAVPVAARGHLVQNRRQALAAFRRDRRPARQEAALGRALARRPTASPVPVTPMYRGRHWHPTPVPLREEAVRPPRHTRGGASAAAMHARRVQGSPMATIARPLGISRPPGSADLRRATPPGPRRLQRRPSARVLPPDVPSRLRRWRANGADRRQLWRELRARAVAPSARTVCRVITRRRRAREGGDAPAGQAAPSTRPPGPSARAVSCVMGCPAAPRSDDAQRYLAPRCQGEARRARAPGRPHAFLPMVRERRGHALAAWMAEATDSGIDARARVARGRPADLAAVTAGLPLKWGNGVTEGHTQRLKRLQH